MNALRTFLLCLLAAGALSAAQGRKWVLAGKPELAFRGLVSTERSEVKLTFSPDGKRLLWGTIDWPGGAGKWDIWESVQEKGKWGAPHPVPFNSPENELDPSFAPDGSGVYFFSNRPGGFGGDDLYFAPFDAARGTYGAATNLGSALNTAGDEWGPVLSADGKTLLFCTDGRGGRGKHDLFTSTRGPGGWQPPQNLGPAINSELDDFDPTFLHDGQTLVFASERGGKGQVDLYVSFRAGGQYGEPTSLGPAVNSQETWDFGASINPAEPGVLYFNSHHPEDKAGGADLYRVRYRLE